MPEATLPCLKCMAETPHHLEADYTATCLYCHNEQDVRQVRVPVVVEVTKGKQEKRV